MTAPVVRCRANHPGPNRCGPAGCLDDYCVVFDDECACGCRCDDWYCEAYETYGVKCCACQVTLDVATGYYDDRGLPLCVPCYWKIVSA